MSKEIILTPNEISNYAVASSAAMDAYRFALEKAGSPMTEEEEADFVSARNAKSGWADLWEYKAGLEKIAGSIKSVCMHAFNCGSSDDLPGNVTWKSSGTTKAFKEGAGVAVATALIGKKLVTKEQLLALISPTDLAKAAGIKVEKLMDMYPDTVEETKKSPSLIIK